MNDDSRERYRARLESLTRTEAEIVAEQASALGRAARALESRLTECAELQAAFAAVSEAVPDGAQRRQALQLRYAEVRKEAETYRWYLVVQREAMGMRRHEQLDRFYPMPPRRL
jgi:hypothetical protein